MFDFRLADIKSRLQAWQSRETSDVKQLAEAVWTQLLASYPAELGYFSDCPSALDMLDWCGLPLTAHLGSMVAADSLSAARHLADLSTGCSPAGNRTKHPPRQGFSRGSAIRLSVSDYRPCSLLLTATRRGDSCPLPTSSGLCARVRDKVAQSSRRHYADRINRHRRTQHR